MTLFGCPICGKNSSYSKYNPINFNDDILGIEVRGLGRGRGFEVTERYSLLGDTWLTGLISHRCRQTLRIIEGVEPASASEVQQLGHGIFTYSLLAGLNGAADGGSKDGKITINELKSFIDDNVPELTQKYKGQAQYPQSWIRGMDFPLVIIK